jgi:MFS family permease
MKIDNSTFHRPDLPRGVVMLGFVSLFMDMSSELIHSLLPALFVSVLGMNMATVGVIEGIAEATASITKVFSGALSDWLGKRKVLAVIGYGLAAITKPLFPIATSVSLVFAARFIDRIGKGIRGAPRDALIADLTSTGNRGAAYGFRQSLDSIGAFLGPLGAIALMALFADDVRTVLWFAVIPAIICIGVLVFGVHEPERRASRHTARLPIHKDEIKRLPAPYWSVVVIGGMFSLARFSEAFLTLRGMELGLPLVFTPVVMLLMSVVYSLTAYPVGLLADRMDRRVLLLLGLGALIGADLLLSLAGNVTVVLLGVAIWGLHMGLTQGLFSAMVADAAPEGLHGTAFGIFNLTSGLVLLAASVIAGVAWDALGSQATFLIGGGFAFLAGLFILVSTLKGRRGGAPER